jgi:DNA-binding transcriptional regulator YhcF (GntR family)
LKRRTIPWTSKHATRIGVHQTTIARSVRILRENNIIGRFTKKELEILDQDRLSKIAEGKPTLDELR